MEPECNPSSEYDRLVAKIVDEAYDDFKNNRDNSHKYKNSYYDSGPEIWDRVSLHTIYVTAFDHAYKQEKEKSNMGKILGKIDLSKIKR